MILVGGFNNSDPNQDYRKPVLVEVGRDKVDDLLALGRHGEVRHDEVGLPAGEVADEAVPLARGRLLLAVHPPRRDHHLERKVQLLRYPGDKLVNFLMLYNILNLMYTSLRPRQFEPEDNFFA